MAQLSRPFQIALGAVLLLGLIGVIAVRVHGSNPSEPVPTSASVPSSTTTTDHHGTLHKADPSTPKQSAAAHTSDPRSHNAAATVHKTAVVHKTSKTTANTPVVHTTSTHSTTVVVHKTTSPSRSTAHSNTTSQAAPHAPRQAAVEHQLAQGKTVLLVFWNPKTSVDREVQGQARALASGSKGTVVVYSALANQVGAFGSITEVVHVYQTPTILIVNRHGVVSTLTGLTDVFALQQAVSEARQANR